MADDQVLSAGDKRVFRSLPVLRTAISLSVLLLGASLLGWYMLDPMIRAQFTPAQIATLLFFIAVMVGFMMSIGLSRAVATSEGLSVRNVLVTKAYTWDQLVGVTFGSGDSWPYLVLGQSEEYPDGETKMLLAIQRAEGAETAQQRVEELRGLIRANRA